MKRSDKEWPSGILPDYPNRQPNKELRKYIEDNNIKYIYVKTVRIAQDKRSRKFLCYVAVNTANGPEIKDITPIMSQSLGYGWLPGSAIQIWSDILDSGHELVSILSFVLFGEYGYLTKKEIPEMIVDVESDQ